MKFQEQIPPTKIVSQATNNKKRQQYQISANFRMTFFSCVWPRLAGSHRQPQNKIIPPLDMVIDSIWVFKFYQTYRLWVWGLNFETIIFSHLVKTKK